MLETAADLSNIPRSAVSNSGTEVSGVDEGKNRVREVLAFPNFDTIALSITDLCDRINKSTIASSWNEDHAQLLDIARVLNIKLKLFPDSYNPGVSVAAGRIALHYFEDIGGDHEVTIYINRDFKVERHVRKGGTVEITSK